MFAKSSHYICLVKVSHFYNGSDSIKSLDNDSTGQRDWDHNKDYESPAHKSMGQREEADIAVVAEDEHGSCCSGIDPNTLKVLERITDSIVKFNLNRGAVGLECRIVSVKDKMDLLQDKVATA